MTEHEPARRPDRAVRMRPDRKRMAMNARGFLLEREGLELFRRAYEGSALGACLEIGSYCGRSSIFLAEGARLAGHGPLFCVDHHRGSEDHQPGGENFDPDLLEPLRGTVDTLSVFMRNIRWAGLEGWAVPVVCEATTLRRYWLDGAFGLVFIDGGHSEADVLADFRHWAELVLPGGFCCFHDVFEDPADGGQGPYQAVQHALETGSWEALDQVDSLAVLQRRER